MRDSRDAIMNVAIPWLLHFSGIQYILGNQWHSIEILSISNLFVICLIFLILMSFVDKFLILIYVAELSYNPNSLKTTSIRSYDRQE